MGHEYTNLALEGGGIRGIAYAGALEILEAKGALNGIRNVAGTSVGAVAGALFCAGYTATEIKELMFELRIQSFNDGQWFFLGGQSRMRKQYGWYRGDRLEEWIERSIAAKTGSNGLTFLQLHKLALANPKFKDLYVTASNLSEQALSVFSWKTFPQMEVATAVRASMSVPLYFRAICLDSTGLKTHKGKGNVFVDGGLVMNYPLNLFDSGAINKETLGLKLERPEQMNHYKQSPEIAPYPISNFRNYVGALYNLTIETLNRKTPMEGELSRTIYISTAGMNPRVRKINRARKELLYESGKRAATDFIQKH
jgi:NTE family protein